ncbi:MAG: sensor histidine kinase [Woeseiaceae bacterium]
MPETQAHAAAESTTHHVGDIDNTMYRQRQTARQIAAGLDDLGRMVNDMLGFAAGAKPSEQIVSVYELLTEVQIAIAPQLDGVTDLVLALDDYTLYLSGNKEALKGALLNLATNAVQSCTGPSKIVLGATCCGRNVRLTVTDDGPGVAEHDFPRLFEPFFTTRPQGTGLGLAVVQAVAQAHGGTVSAQSHDAGTRFTIRLPGRAFYRGNRHD